MRETMMRENVRTDAGINISDDSARLNRMIVEARELAERHNKLIDYLNLKKTELGRIDLGLMEDQRDAMGQYLEALVARVGRETIRSYKP